MKKSILSLLFLLAGSTFILQAQTLQNFKGTSWYIAEMISYQSDKAAQEQSFSSQRNTVTFSEDGKYDLHFPDMQNMRAAGFFVEENFTIAMSDATGKAYSYVFQINKRTEEEVVAIYVPFRPSQQKTVLIFKRKRNPSPTNEGTRNPDFTASSNAENFSGIWRSREDISGVRLKIAQRGNFVHGVHDAKGTDLNRYNLIGEVKGDEAIVELRSQVSHDIVGKARIRKLPNGQLSWTVLEDNNASFLRSRTIDKVSLKKYGEYTN